MLKEGIELHRSFTLKEIAMLMTMIADIANKETKKQEAENEKDTAEAVPKSKVTS